MRADISLYTAHIRHTRPFQTYLLPSRLLLSVPESNRFLPKPKLLLADFTAGRESHPALKIESLFANHYNS